MNRKGAAKVTNRPLSREARTGFTLRQNCEIKLRHEGLSKRHENGVGIARNTPPCTVEEFQQAVETTVTV